MLHLGNYLIYDCPGLTAWHSASVERMLGPMLKLVLVHTTATSTTTVNTIVVASCTRTLATASAAAAATVTSMTIATGPFVAAYA